MKINFFNLIIEILTILSIILALAVITSTNPVIAIIFLIGLFLTVAFYLILMGLNFIGLSYLLVYIGAITVLVLFIVMMISTDILHTVEVGPDYSKLIPLAYSLAVLFLLLFLITIPSFIIDFSSFEIYNFINNFILIIFNKETYNFNFLDNSIVNNIAYYINKLSLGFLLPSNNLNNDSTFIFDTISNSNKGPFNNYPFLNRDLFVEYNPSTYSLIGSGKNPTGFYYWHPYPSNTEAIIDGLNSYWVNNKYPFYFPIGWYSDDPYTVFKEWASNKNINLLLWSEFRSNVIIGWKYSTDLNFFYNHKMWNNFLYNLFAPFLNYNYGGGAYYAPWYTISPDFIWKTFYSPVYGIPLHNYYLNLTWLNIPYYPEFLVEFPNSPVYSPNYFIHSENSFGNVHHIIDSFNITNNDLLINNVEPVTLLYKNLQIQSLGQAIYGRYALLLILSSFLLLLAMVAPILLTKTEINN